MRSRQMLTVLSFLIAALGAVVTITGIFSTDGDGPFQYMSIRGESVEVYGIGVYQHMPADVAIQGIAQDYVTLFLAIPLLLISLFYYRRGSLAGKIVMVGLLLYFTVTYMIYLAMGMYNELFLLYVAILACSLTALIWSLASFDYKSMDRSFEGVKSLRPAAYFLLINCILIALLWLGVVVPPLLDGSLYPQELYHFTTLIVQGFDLAIFLPLGVVSALLALKGTGYGYVFTTVYVIFLAVLMIALTAKVLFMAAQGQNVIPVIFIMPTIALLAITFSALLLKQMNQMNES